MKKAISILVVLFLALFISGCGNNKIDIELEDIEAIEKTPEGTVLYDDEYVKITFEGLKMTDYGFPKLILKTENKTDSMKWIGVRNLSINGFTVSDIRFKNGNDKVEANKTSFYNIKIDYNYRLFGIKTISNAKFNLEISGYMDDVETEEIVIGTGEEGTFDEMDDQQDKLLFENSGLKMISRGLKSKDLDTNFSKIIENIYGDKTNGVLLYAENNSEKDYYIYGGDIIINGVEIDGSVFMYVLSDNKAYDFLLLKDYVLEKNGIEEIKTVELTIEIEEINSNIDDEFIETVKLNF